MKREMIEIGTTIRVENGPARKTAIATEELLDDAVTVSHYHIGLKDALGKVIVLGEPMTYLDYRGEDVWYVYQLQEVGVNAAGEVLLPDSKHILKTGREPEDREAVRTVEKWIPVAVETTKERALTAAHLLED
ncbi:MAG: hypothetical protein IMZ69_02400 [Spirochaetes bacterium]|nr:hypothetical protein [Spirochaetota bacterium]